MYIDSVTLVNFRCFGEKPTKITLEPDTTAFVGENGSGKSTVLEALKRLFSPVSAERRIRRDDFHFPPNERLDEIDGKHLSIDVVFAFPELRDDDDGIDDDAGTDEGVSTRTVPVVFNDMCFDPEAPEGGDLKARMRLEAEWTRHESFEEDVSYQLYWVTTLNSKIPFGPDDPNKYPVSRINQRHVAQIRYIPAARDGASVTRVALGQLLRRLELSGDWDDDTRQSTIEAADSLDQTLQGTPVIRDVTTSIRGLWQRVYDDRYMASRCRYQSVGPRGDDS